MISGLVVRLSTDSQMADGAIRQICGETSIQIGVRRETNLPIVLETKTPGESRDVTNWLADLPGVAHVDVTFTCFEDELVDGSKARRTPSSSLDRDGGQLAVRQGKRV